VAEYALSGREYAPPRRSTKSARRAEGSSGTKAALAAGLVGILLSALGLVLYPLTELRRFELTGSTRVSAGELALMAGVAPGTHIFDIDPGRMAALAAAHPLLESVEVRARFPDTLSFSVRERTAVAVLYARSSDGRQRAHCVDRHGVVFAQADHLAVNAALPVLSGIEVTGLSYGMSLGDELTPLLESLGDLADSEPALAGALSELRLVARPDAPPEVIIYPANYRLPVRARADLDAELVKSMLLILDVVETGGFGPSIRELDLRSDTYVFRTKEAVSG